MRKLTLFLISTFSLLFGGALGAEETGAVAINSAAVGKDNEWQNWVFAASAALTASLGIFAITVSQGASSQSH